jgi:hypothetical protein
MDSKSAASKRVGSIPISGTGNGQGSRAIAGPVARPAAVT